MQLEQLLHFLGMRGDVRGETQPPPPPRPSRRDAAPGGDTLPPLGQRWRRRAENIFSVFGPQRKPGRMKAHEHGWNEDLNLQIQAN